MPHVAIIGGGIVGLATGYRLIERFPGTRVTVLEKEAGVGAHQSSHNSGVLHSGIYYKPGTLRAANCREGKRAMQAFCDAEGIPYSLCGKVIVATDEAELPTLDTILERGRANGVRCEMVSRERLLEIEPHAAGIRAIHVPEAGIISYLAVCRRLAEKIVAAGGEVRTGARVVGVRRLAQSSRHTPCAATDQGNTLAPPNVTHNVPHVDESLRDSQSRLGETRPRAATGHILVETTSGEVAADYLVNCAGLHCDRVTKLTGQQPGAKIVPFRGEFFELKPEAHHLCRGLIYPVPDPKFPFLGVHFTRTIAGGVECGPNAVLAFAREGYRKLNINPRDLIESLTYPGFLRLVARNWRTGIGEVWRSFSKRAFVRSLARLVPEIRVEHLEPAPAGVRAQALGHDGKLVDDFLIQASERIINVGNAPSPAATASLNVGKLIVDKLAEQMT